MYSSLSAPCLLPVCASPGSPLQGAVVSDGRTATYSCSVGYSLQGPRVVTCGGSGQMWLEAAPSCSE